MMQIADLPYFANISEAELIVGAAGVLVDASATASGPPSNTLTLTNAGAWLLPSGASVAIGRGLAAGTGEDPTANVTVAGDGDIVLGGTRSRYLPRLDTAVSVGVVIAFDKPS